MRIVLARYLEVFPDEKERMRFLQDFLRATTDPKQLFHRKNFAGHIAATGFVLSPDGKRLALVRHKILGRHLPPGGHVEEADSSVRAAALREVLEETNIPMCRHLAFHADPDLPFDIDTHEIPANPKKNEPKHLHHDFRFLFRAESEVDPAQGAGSGEGEWIWRPIEDAMEEETFKVALKKLGF